MTTQEVILLATARAYARNGTGRRIRKEADVSMHTVASAIGSTAPVLSRWERGERMPSGKPAIAWAELLSEMERAVKAANR